MYKHILMPTDGSTCSEKAIEHGLKLAHTIAAEVTFLYVLEDLKTTLWHRLENVPYNHEIYEALKKAAEEVLAEAERRARQAGVEAKILLVEKDHPTAAIVKAGVSHDLIIMGTHGRTGFDRLVLGSVTEGVLRLAKTPLLVARCSREES